MPACGLFFYEWKVFFWLYFYSGIELLACMEILNQRIFRLVGHLNIAQRSQAAGQHN